MSMTAIFISISSLILVINASFSCPSNTSKCNITLTNFTLDKINALPNPFKGFVPYSSLSPSRIAAFPTSMENKYFAMKDLMQGPNQFNLQPIQTQLQLIKSRNHQAIIRVFADYPNHYTGESIFIPNYLVGKVSLCTYSFSGGGKSPNYDDPNLIAAMISLIEKIRSVYDGDKRIAVFQTGFLGHWGEQHTQPPCSFANITTQTTIFTALKNAFKKTKLMIRYPDVKGTIQTSSLGMGYHDDSFTQDTFTDYPYFFQSRMIRANATNQWKLFPIGGQVRPQFWLCIFGKNINQSCANETAAAAAKGDYTLIPEDITTCIYTLHFSWAWNFGLFANTNKLSSDDYERALIAAGDMGYSFNLLNSSILLFQVNNTWLINASAIIRNDGVAPFYYDLSLSVVIAGTAFNMISNSSLSQLLPNASAVLVYNNAEVNPPIQEIYLQFKSKDTDIPINFALRQVRKKGILYIDGVDHLATIQNSGVQLLMIIVVSGIGMSIITALIAYKLKKNKQKTTLKSEVQSLIEA